MPNLKSFQELSKKDKEKSLKIRAKLKEMARKNRREFAAFERSYMNLLSENGKYKVEKVKVKSNKPLKKKGK